MKTTVEIADPLLREARRLAADEGTTLRELLETGLRLVLQSRRTRRPFRLRDASVAGRGLQPEFAEQGWDKIARAAYEGRGG